MRVSAVLLSVGLACYAADALHTAAPPKPMDVRFDMRTLTNWTASLYEPLQAAKNFSSLLSTALSAQCHPNGTNTTLQHISGTSPQRHHWASMVARLMCISRPCVRRCSHVALRHPPLPRGPARLQGMRPRPSHSVERPDRPGRVVRCVAGKEACISASPMSLTCDRAVGRQ